MSLTQLLGTLAALGPVLEPVLNGLEAQGIAELNTIIASVSSPDLKLALQGFAAFVDTFAKAEIAKLG